MSHYRKHHNHHNVAPANRSNSVAGSEQSGQSSQSASPDHELLVTLFRELFQTEKSAKLHSTREADRLGDGPPAAALRAVVEHATRVLNELPGLAEKNDLPVSAAGMALGVFLSNCRQFAVDHLVEAERSYRGTLIGVRHGVDLVELIGKVAKAKDNSELSEWCATWLQERKPLVEQLVQALQWFAENPDKATSRPLTLKVLGRLKALVPQVRSQNAATASNQA
jgi:hypothetical protein